MSGYKFFYKLSRNDLDLNIPEINFVNTSIVGAVENDRDEGLKSPKDFRYLKLPKRQQYPLDLNAGITDYKYRTNYEYNYTLDELCSYIMNMEADDKQKNSEAFEVLTHRGCLAQLMKTPYLIRSGSFQNNWRMSATKYKNKLYLMRCNIHDFVPTKTIKTPQETHHFKFQQYCFSSDPKDEPDTSRPVDEENQIYCIYRSQLLNFNLLYTAEIGGVLCAQKILNFKELDACRFVHTKLIKKTPYDWKKNIRVLDWWIKAYLANVNDIYVGQKSDQGFVQDPVDHVERSSLTLNQNWSPKICINFVHTFITKVNEIMCDVNSPYTSYEFHFSADRVNIKIHEGKTKYSFLNDAYVEYMHKN